MRVIEASIALSRGEVTTGGLQRAGTGQPFSPRRHLPSASSIGTLETPAPAGFPAGRSHRRPSSTNPRRRGQMIISYGHRSVSTKRKAVEVLMGRASLKWHWRGTPSHLHVFCSPGRPHVLGFPVVDASNTSKTHLIINHSHDIRPLLFSNWE